MDRRSAVVVGFMLAACGFAVVIFLASRDLTATASFATAPSREVSCGTLFSPKEFGSSEAAAERACAEVTGDQQDIVILVAALSVIVAAAGVALYYWREDGPNRVLR